MTDAAMARGRMGGLALGCAVFVSSAFAETALTNQALHLLTGNQREIRLGKPLERTAIGDPETIDALLPKGQGTAMSVLIITKKLGAANTMVWTQGDVAMTCDMQVDATTPVPGDPTVVAQGDTAAVSGQPKDIYTPARTRRSTTATSGAERLKDGNVVDTISMNVPGTMQVDIWVVGLSKMVLKEAGFTFGHARGGFGFQTFAPSLLPKVTFDSNSLSTESAVLTGLMFNLLVSLVSRGLFVDLSLPESNGITRMLAEPSLVALSNQNANFLAGGEIPIPALQALGTMTIEYKPSDIGLTASPTTLLENRTTLKVTPEASGLDFGRGVAFNGAMVPTIVTHRIDTIVGLGSGESFVTGGLVNRSMLSNVDKVPFLGDVPVVGTLFKRLNYNQEERELVIIVTSHLVRPMAHNAPISKMLPGQNNGWDHDTTGDPV